MNLRTRLRQLPDIVGLDAEIGMTLMYRGWTIFAGGVTVVFIPLLLSDVEQGYFYTFSALIALQIFFELGMNQVVVQIVSHEYAHISNRSLPDQLADSPQLDRIRAVTKLLRRWYAIAATLFFIIVSVSGTYFFSQGANLATSAWLGPWLLLTFASAATLFLSPLLAVLEGCGQISHVTRVRLIQSIVGYGIFWIALALGGNLWAASMTPFIAAIVTGFWLYRNNFFHTLTHRPFSIAGAPTLSWYADIFPFQWRIAISWMSGYFIFQLFTPLAFSLLGPIEAGQLGLSLTIFSALLTFGMSWVNAKVPTMAMLAARNERTQLNKLFNHLLTRALAFTATASTAIVLTLILISEFELAAVGRFVSIETAACIAIVTVINCFIFAAAAYVRAHKEEPMLGVSIAWGLATLAGTTIGAQTSLLNMMAAYALVTSCLALPWTAILFMRYYRKQTN